eukprot:CAMPEP_0182447786 /NCGR_PEP_ID=MMETSP1172-20130603/20178_1 /TAXON_ID=708627 /ORGANISM="Timspurckia oligopyrenoides, Strain CCMP3278" /LENGTH=139 /DNA_ID=CAMNT_0024644365 /DNA_START=856 /DNA_END=1275 /DNA_ORIENTATION=-
MVAGWQPENLGLEALAVIYLSLIAILPQLKQWSGMENPPMPIRLLQRLKVLYRVPSDGIHRACIVNGWWNSFFDALRAEVILTRNSRQPQPDRLSNVTQFETGDASSEPEPVRLHSASLSASASNAAVDVDRKTASVVD